MTVKTYDEAGRGRKQCPDCTKYVGVSVKACSCGHEFIGKLNVPRTNVPQNVRRISVPAGACPVKLEGIGYEAVSEWCNEVVEIGLRQNNLFLPHALKYFAGQFYTGANLERAKLMVDAWDQGLPGIQEDEFDDPPDVQQWEDDGGPTNDLTVRQCPKCEIEIAADDEYCIHCGFHFEDPTMIVCPDCDEENPSDNEVCTNCGYDFEDSDLFSQAAYERSHRHDEHPLVTRNWQQGRQQYHYEPPSPRPQIGVDRYRERSDEDEEFLRQEKEKIDPVLIVLRNEWLRKKNKWGNYDRAWSQG